MKYPVPVRQEMTQDVSSARWIEPSRTRMTARREISQSDAEPVKNVTTLADLKACREKSVMTMNTPVQNAHDVAELVFAVVQNSDRNTAENSRVGDGRTGSHEVSLTQKLEMCSHDHLRGRL